MWISLIFRLMYYLTFVINLSTKVISMSPALLSEMPRHRDLHVRRIYTSPDLARSTTPPRDCMYRYPLSSRWYHCFPSLFLGPLQWCGGYICLYIYRWLRDQGDSCSFGVILYVDATFPMVASSSVSIFRTALARFRPKKFVSPENLLWCSAQAHHPVLDQRGNQIKILNERGRENGVPSKFPARTSTGFVREHPYPMQLRDEARSWHRSGTSHDFDARDQGASEPQSIISSAQQQYMGGTYITLTFSAPPTPSAPLPPSTTPSPPAPSQTRGTSDTSTSPSPPSARPHSHTTL